jgi:hypothetical protein
MNQQNLIQKFLISIHNFTDRYEDVDELIEQQAWLKENNAPIQLIAKFEAEFGETIAAVKQPAPFKWYEYLYYLILNENIPVLMHQTIILGIAMTMATTLKELLTPNGFIFMSFFIVQIEMAGLYMILRNFAQLRHFIISSAFFGLILFMVSPKLTYNQPIEAELGAILGLIMGMVIVGFLSQYITERIPLED